MALTGGAYESTYAVTDVVNAGATYSIASNKNVAVDKTGFNQGALYDLLNTIVTNWNACMTAVEADGATTTTYTPDNAFTTLSSQGHGLSANGMHQKDLIDLLYDMETKFKAVLTLLDADGGVTKTNYTTTVNALGTAAALDLNDTVIGSYGIDQDKLVAYLDDFVTKMNGLLAHMDTDNS